MRGIIACALCDGVAAMYCESDQASLCWDCDAKVHGANFLVARHTRVLLCRNCQENTPWKASGVRLSPIVSVCERCAAGGMGSSVVEEDICDGAGDGRTEEEEEDYGDDVSDTEEEGEEEEEDEGENQVVPWSLASPPPACSSSGEESSSSTDRSGSCLSKRLRDNEEFASQDLPSSSSRWNHLVASSPPLASFLSRSASPVLSSYSSKKSRISLLETTPLQSSDEIASNHMPTPGDHTAVVLMSSDLRRPPI